MDDSSNSPSTSLSPADRVKAMPRNHSFVVGIDSDGCVFDTMELKHKECFTPCIIRVWGLQPIARQVRQAAEYINLYSQMRGLNRFKALVTLFDLLEDWPEAKQRMPELPNIDGLRNWVKNTSKLGADSLIAEYEKTQCPSLKTALEWTQAVNETVKAMVHNIQPVPGVAESLAKIAEQAEIVVVSAADDETLRREWGEHHLLDHVTAVAGQEVGSKAESLLLAKADHYAENHVLMLGDAPGDYEAAQAAGALFFPIIPGQEVESWERLQTEALDRFFNQTYAGDYEAKWIEAFMAVLPTTPPWKS